MGAGVRPEPTYSADNPFAPKAPPGPTYSPDNPFAPKPAPQAAPDDEGRLSKVIGNVAHFATHPWEVVTGALGEAADAFLTPVQGSTVSGAQAMGGKGGHAPGAPRSLPEGTVVTPENTPGSITHGQQVRAALQTTANVALPSVFKGAGTLGEALGGRAGATAGRVLTAGGVGAVQSPDDPLTGFLSGSLSYPVAAGYGRLASKAITKATSGPAAKAQAQAVLPAGVNVPPARVAEGLDMARRYLKSDGVDPASVPDRVAALPPDALGVDVGGSGTQALARGAIATPGSQSAQVLTQAIKGRQANEPQALRTALSTAGGEPAEDPTAFRTVLDAHHTAVTGPAYAAARDEFTQRFPDGFAHPLVDASRDTDIGRQAWGAMMETRRHLMAQGKIGPLPVQTTQVPVEEPIRYPNNLYDKDGNLPAALPRTRTVMQTQTQQMLDFDALQMYKQEFGNRINWNRLRAGLSEGGERAAAGTMGALNDALRQSDQLPAYKAADNLSATHRRTQEAWDQGIEDAPLQPHQISARAASLADMTPQELQQPGMPMLSPRQAYLKAIQSQLWYDLGDRNKGAPVAAGLTSPNAQDYARTILPNGDAFNAAADLWKTRRDATQYLTGNSATAQTSGAMSDIAGGGGLNMAHAGQALMSAHPASVIGTVLNRVTRNYFGQKAAAIDATAAAHRATVLGHLYSAGAPGAIPLDVFARAMAGQDGGPLGRTLSPAAQAALRTASPFAAIRRPDDGSNGAVPPQRALSGTASPLSARDITDPRVGTPEYQRQAALSAPQDAHDVVAGPDGQQLLRIFGHPARGIGRLGEPGGPSAIPNQAGQWADDRAYLTGPDATPADLAHELAHKHWDEASPQHRRDVEASMGGRRPDGWTTNPAYAAGLTEAHAYALQSAYQLAQQFATAPATPDVQHAVGQIVNQREQALPGFTRALQELLEDPAYTRHPLRAAFGPPAGAHELGLAGDAGWRHASESDLLDTREARLARERTRARLPLPPPAP